MIRKLFFTAIAIALSFAAEAQKTSVSYPTADTWVGKGITVSKGSSSTLEIRSYSSDIVNYVPLSHPAMLHTVADITRVKGKLTVSPWKEAYAHLCKSKYAQSSYTNGTSALLDGYLKRMDQKNWSATYADYSNYTAFMRDAAASYQLALRYQLSGETAYADAAVNVMNAWKNTCKGLLKLGGYTDSIPDPNEYLIMINVHQMANAAELLRDYSGWQASDFKAFQNWMKNAFYTVALQFLKNHQGGQGTQHAWLNWDLASMTAVLSIGILCDDNNAINFAISYFKNEKGLYSENRMLQRPWRSRRAAVKATTSMVSWLLNFPAATTTSRPLNSASRRSVSKERPI